MLARPRNSPVHSPILGPLLACCLLAGAESALPALQSGPPASAKLQNSANSWDQPGTELGSRLRNSARGRHLIDELLIQLVSWHEFPQLRTELESSGYRILGAIPRQSVLRVGLPQGLDSSIEAAIVSQLPGVKWTGPHAVGSGAEVPNDPKFNLQWQHENNGMPFGQTNADLDSPGAWDIQRGSADIVVAVIDSGIDALHPEFSGRLLPGYDYVQEDADPQDELGHGTAVTGLLAANWNDGFGVAGMDPACSVLPLRIITVNNDALLFDLIQAIDFAVAAGAHVINLSVQGFAGDPVLVDSLANAKAAGTISLAAAGNLGIGYADISWPSASPDTITIGSSDPFDLHSPTSGTGAAVDFLAPGSFVTTVSVHHFGGAANFSGTSAATPLAAGIVSLLLAEVPDLSFEQVYEYLLAGAQDQVGDPLEDTPGWDPFHGHGRLNAALSLQALCACTEAGDFHASPTSLPLPEAGNQYMHLAAGPARAGDVYWIFGSATGTAPGIQLGSVLLPLVPDAYSVHTIKVGLPLFQNTLGLLDADGNATASLQLPPNLDPSLAGAQLFHAYILYADDLTIDFASSPASLELTAPK